MADNDASSSVHVTVVGLTDVGRVREHNEDNLLVMNASTGQKLDNGERAEWNVDSAVLLAVADGMGGAAAGEVASQHAVDRFAKDLGAADYSEATPDQLAARIDQTLQAANDDILQDVEANPDRKGMGTTMTSAIVVGGTAYISQVGDSRCYLLRKGKLLRLTRDQSLIEQLIDEGTITEEEAERMGGHNIILQALGVEETVRPDTKQFPILRGDLLLFCSDGLSGMIKDDVIENILIEAGNDLVEAVQNLIQSANENGGRDNVTVVLGHFTGEGLREPMAAVAQDDIEQTGVRFKAPPPPEVPNPMKKLSIIGIAILAVLAVLLFFVGRSDADLNLTLEPSGLDMRLVLENEAGEEVKALDAARAEASFPKLEMGKYILRAKAPNYFDYEATLTISEPGVLDKAVKLAAMPVQLFVSSEVSHVNVKVTPSGDGATTLDGIVMSDRVLELNNLPAGPAELTAEREGFAPFETTLQLKPGGELTYALQLVELKGTIVFPAAAGVEVTVVDSRGDQIATGRTSPTEELRLSVRIGTQHEVRCTAPGFEAFSERVDVTEGADTAVALELQRVRRTVRFRATTELDGELERKAGQSWELVRTVFGNANELSRAVLLEPGSYRINWQQGGKKRTHAFTVTPPGDNADVLEVSLDG